MRRGLTPVSSPKGTTWSGFDPLDRPTETRLADGSQVSDTYTGWWSHVTVHKVNSGAQQIQATTSTSTDSLGRVVSVTEPPATKADGSSLMNPAETTTYVYDHEGRVLEISKPGSDSNGGGALTQVRTRKYDDFGWLLSQSDPEQPTFQVKSRDARGNPLRTWDGQTEIVRTYDPAGRPINSRREGETTTYDWGGTPVTWYEVFAYDSLSGFDFGRSNGRLVWSIRANHALVEHDTIDFGWAGSTSFFHYNGPGGRLGFRQQTDVLMPEPALPGPQSVQVLATPTKTSPLVEEFRQYFEKQGRKAKSKDDVMKAAASPSLAMATALSSPQSPSGLARWSYSWDGAGRLQSITYPRRDEGYPTVVTYGYDAGLLSSVSATFNDPFARGAVGTAQASLFYDAAGRVRETDVSTGAQSGDALRIVSERDPDGLARPSIWDFYLRQGTGTALHEHRAYTYDPSGNIAQISSSLQSGPDSYLYDSRGRLVQDTLLARPFNPESREYDGFGNLAKVTGSGITLLTTERSSNRLASSLASYDGAGRMKEDLARSLGRDYYPDGALTTEFKHASGTPAAVHPEGETVWEINGAGEVVLSYWGDPGYGENQKYRSMVRDESAKILTEYRAQKEPGCIWPNCAFWDQYYSDIVRMGPWATAVYTRRDGNPPGGAGPPRVAAHRHGSVRHDHVDGEARQLRAGDHRDDGVEGEVYGPRAQPRVGRRDAPAALRLHARSDVRPDAREVYEAGPGQQLLAVRSAELQSVRLR